MRQKSLLNTSNTRLTESLGDCEAGVPLWKKFSHLGKFTHKFTKEEVFKERIKMRKVGGNQKILKIVFK